MNKSIALAASVALAGAAALIGQMSAEAGLQIGARQGASTGSSSGFSAQPIAGADVICGAITGPTTWGGLGGVSAYSLGTTSCNIGTTILSWVASTNQHPVMPQNIYRYKTVDGSGRFEQVGQSWLKHAFCALQQGLCGACSSCGGGCPSCLGIGCSDPYTSSRNGQQNIMGPRYDINASTGAFTYPMGVIPLTGDTLFKRINVNNTDLNPALNPGALYYGEAQYVSNQDALAGNQNNNASYIRMTVGALSGVAPNQFYQMSFAGGTVQMQAALNAWKVNDPAVTILNVDVPLDGRFVVGYRATPIAGGLTHYEYAIYNYNSHRSLEKFIVPIPDGVVVTNIGFHDIDYHSQSVLPPLAQVDNVDWTATLAGGALTWATSPYTGTMASGGNEHTANALRWGTTFNFRFDANTAATPVSATLDLFRPGVPTTVSATVDGPSAPAIVCPTDINGNGCTNGSDIACILGVWTGAGTYAGCTAGVGPYAATDINQDCRNNGLDVAIVLGAWGPCPGGSCPGAALACP